MKLRSCYVYSTVITLSIITFLVLNIEAYVFGTINNVEELVELQEEVIENISSYVYYVPEHKRRVVERYISLSEEENSIAFENITQFLASPLNGYILVKRLTRDLQLIETILKNYTDYKRNFSLLSYPTDADYRSALAQILVIIHLYEITIKEFTEGSFTRNYRRSSDIFEVFSLQMTSSDCYEVAKKAFEIEEYEIAADWFDGAILKYELQCREGGCFYNDSMKLNNMRIERNNSLIRYLQTDLFEYKPMPHFDNIADDPDILKEWPFLNRYLCHKEVLLQKRLHCKYQYGPHPFLRLARFKIEVLNLKPDIIRYIDVISDEESEVLKNITMDQINSNMSGSIQHTSSLRNSIFIDDHVSRVAAVVSRRSLDISGLTNVMAPGINTIHYGPAGYFSSHVDSVSTYEIHGKNTRCLHRIIAQATVEYDLSEPELGGITAFHHPQLSVFPLKNSALLWRTLLPSNREDNSTAHASCPVLYGSKMTAIKWMTRPEDLQSAPEHLLTSDEVKKFKPLSYETIRRLENK